MGYTSRQLSEAFSLITGLPLQLYHRIRKLDYAAEKIIKKEYKSLADLAQEVSYNDQAAFSKAFKKEFGVSPSEADDFNIVTHGKMIIKISVDWDDDFEMRTEKTRTKTMFGISEAKVNEIQEALGLAAFYGMNNNQADIAYSIAEEYDLDIKSSFDFLNDYLELCTWESVKQGVSVTKYLVHSFPEKLEETSPEYVFMYKKFDMLPTESFDFIESYYRLFQEFDIEKITERHIQLYRVDDYNGYNAKEIEQIIHDASQYPEIDWKKFIDWLKESTNTDSEIAVESYLDFEEWLTHCLDFLNKPEDDNKYYPTNPDLTAEDIYDIFVDYSSENDDYR